MNTRQSLAAGLISLSAFCFGGCAETNQVEKSPPDPVATKMNELEDNLGLDTTAWFWDPSDTLSFGTATDRLSEGDRLATREKRLNNIIPVGQGIYVFPATRDFPETLADFRETHPDIISVTPGPGTSLRYKSSTGFGEVHSQVNSFVVITAEKTKAEAD